jgi:predicted alpha-1,2-mannosidase
MKRFFLKLPFLFLLLPGIVQGQFSPASYVNPFIGSANQTSSSVNWKNGETFPGAVLPWGMVSVSPHNSPGSKSGYIYGQPYIYGFGQVHLSGVGCSDLGNIVIMPTTGNIDPDCDNYRSHYGQEKAFPGYYKTTLEPSGIKAEMTVTTRSSISRYTFKKNSGFNNVLINVSDILNARMRPANGKIAILSSSQLEGWSESGHFCGAPNQTQKVFFYAEFSQKADSVGTWKNKNVSALKNQSGKEVGAFFRFNGKYKVILVKIGISYISMENAKLNLEHEQQNFDFNRVRKNAKKKWNQYLSRIKIKGGTKPQKIIFYSALYHMLLHPSIFSDANGEYLAMGHNRVAKSRNIQYDVFSLWDTYRNEHIFLTMFFPEQEQGMVQSLLNMYEENHWLPKWELAGHDADVMVGDPAPVMLTETYVYGIHNFDLNLAYKAMKHNATDTIDNPIRRYLKQYLDHHFVPASIRGSVSMTLEYAMSDYAIATIAKILGYDKDFEEFQKRSRNYSNLFDPETGFLRPKNSDESWFEPFNPDKFKGTGFIEGTAWNYLFSVPFDIKNLAQLMGGDSAFVLRLQQMFNEKKFVLNNEPDIAYPYLFTYFNGQSWRSKKEISEAMNKNFNTTPGGLPGNDDCGTLSAWYVFSAIGFYPVDPTSGNLRLGQPLFKKVILDIDPQFYSGKIFTIINKNSLGNRNRDRSLKLNHLPYNKEFISHLDIEKGGKLVF